MTVGRTWSGRTRRAFLALTGTATMGLAGCLDSDTESDYGWSEADSPVEKTLYDVVMSVDGPYAVGEDGRVVSRHDGDWKVVSEDGPGNEANPLSSAAVTDDGRHIWFVGGSGAVGQRNVTSREGTDYSAPNEKTSSWEDVAAVGAAGREQVYLINGSGELLSGVNRDGGIEWEDVTKPGGGVEPTAIGFTGDIGYIADSDGNVYRTADGSEWERIGIRSEDVVLNDIAPLDSQTVNVATGEGSILLYNGHNWLRSDAGQDGLQAVDREGDRGLAVGTNGAIYELEDADWAARNTAASRTLYGATLGTTDYASVAVGGNGTILERFR